MKIDSKRKIAMFVGIFGFFIASILYWIHLGYVSTDNARVKMANVWVSPEVSGYIKKVNFKDGDAIKAGDIVVELDSEKYEIELKKADANYKYLQSEYKRSLKLKKDDFISDSDLDAAKNRFEIAEQTYKLAKYNFDKTKIIAQNDGVIANFDTVKIGDFVSIGSTIFNIVNKSDIWIEANFKEVDVRNIKIGQIADVEIDTFSGKKYKAEVVNISPAVGSEFSLLPAQNSSGNWIKVIQRVNVKLKLDENEDVSKLSSGMSAYVSIKIRD